MTEQSCCSNKKGISIDNYALNFYTCITTPANAEMVGEYTFYACNDEAVYTAYAALNIKGLWIIVIAGRDY